MVWVKNNSLLNSKTIFNFPCWLFKRCLYLVLFNFLRSSLSRFQSLINPCCSPVKTMTFQRNALFKGGCYLFRTNPFMSFPVGTYFKNIVIYHFLTILHWSVKMSGWFNMLERGLHHRERKRRGKAYLRCTDLPRVVDCVHHDMFTYLSLYTCIKSDRISKGGFMKLINF